MADTKRCSKCRKTKLLSEFHFHPNTKDGRSSHCKECQRNYDAARDRSGEKSKPKPLGYIVALTYGLTLDELNAMFTRQNNLCFICHKSETMKLKGKLKRLSVDHNHETDEVRALLCSRCNRILAEVGESVDYLQRLIDYINLFAGKDQADT
jgi:phage FluMu protein Com